MSEITRVILTSVSSALVALIVSFLTSRAKQKEIKLANYHKERIETIKTLYGLIVDLRNAHIKLFYVDVFIRGHHVYKTALQQWLLSFDALHTYYSRNRILLIENSRLNNRLRTSLNRLPPLRVMIYDEHNRLDEIENMVYGDLDRAYNDEQGAMSTYFKELQDKSKINPVDDFLDTVRADLETYFQKLL